MRHRERSLIRDRSSHSPAFPRGQQVLAVLVVTVAASLTFCHSVAAAIRLPHIDEPAAESLLRDLKAVHLPPLVVKPAGVLAHETYGSGSAVTESFLRTATDDEVHALATERLATSSTGEHEVRQCISTALKGVAGNYRDALSNAIREQQAPEWPNFQTDFTAGVTGCLKETFAEAPEQIVEQVANYVGQQAAQYAEQALHANSAAGVFSRWIDVTAEQVEPPTPTPSPTPATPTRTTTTTPASSDGSSFPWWILIVGIAIAGGAFYFLKQKGEQ